MRLPESGGRAHSAPMKYPAALTKSLLMAASIGMVVPVVAQTAPKPPQPAKPTKPVTPAPEEEPKVDGFEIKRPGGGFLGVKAEGLRLVVKFYDEDKKPTEPAKVSRASARWNPVNKTGEERTVLNMEGGVLASPAVLRPPYTFRVFLTLLDENGTALESHVIDARQLGAAKE